MEKIEELIDKFVDNPSGGAVIKVIGVGGGGGNAVNYMHRKGVEGVTFVVCNTDAQDLRKSPVQYKIQLGKQLTDGLGAGSKPERGRAAAEESIAEIEEMLQNTQMVFITAGMGGGTGTGAAPVIAKKSKEMGILTVAVVTMPERYEPSRYDVALQGVEEMKKYVDALLVINNDKIEELYPDLYTDEADEKADELLCIAARGIAEIITRTGDRNVDFEDVQTAMANSGIAHMGIGRASGDDRAIRAAEAAITSPLLENSDIRGAKHLLVNIMMGEKKLLKKEESAIKEYVLGKAGRQVDVKYGRGTNTELGEDVEVTIIATGFDVKDKTEAPPKKSNNDTTNSDTQSPDTTWNNEKSIGDIYTEGDKEFAKRYATTHTPQPNGSYGNTPDGRKRTPVLLNSNISTDQKERPALGHKKQTNEPTDERRSLFAFNNNKIGQSASAYLNGLPD